VRVWDGQLHSLRAELSNERALRAALQADVLRAQAGLPLGPSSARAALVVAMDALHAERARFAAGAHGEAFEAELYRSISAGACVCALVRVCVCWCGCVTA
jgi:hypothetical protein